VKFVFEAQFPFDKLSSNIYKDQLSQRLDIALVTKPLWSIGISLAVTDSYHVESTTVLFPQINHGRFWETSCFTLAKSAWLSLRRSVLSVPLMVTVLILPSDRGRKDSRLFSNQRD